MKAMIDQISLFLPAYNEGEVIAETVTKADKVLQTVAKKYEILVIDDGSKDNTAKEVEKLIKTNKNIRLFQHKPNRGYGGALKSGFYESKYDPIVFIDSDGQFDFSEVTKLIDQMEKTKADVVIGYRIKRNDPPFRLLLANLLKVWNLFWFGMWVKDVDCAFKLVRRQVIDGIPHLISDGGIISTEFLARVKKANFKIAQVGVNHYPRTTGVSTGDKASVIKKAVFESLKLWYALNFK
jgi:glycosyltransferase involved in cell wall biosynthesis